MSFSREGKFGVIYTDEALPRSPSMESDDFSGARKPRPVRSTSISLSSEPTQSGLSFVLGLEEEEQTLEHSYSLHEDIEKLFDKTPEITLTDLLSSGTESLPSGRGIEIEPETPIAAGERVLEEYEVTSHRRSSFPHIHVPLKSLHNHSVKNFATMMDDIPHEKKKRRKRKGSKSKSHHKKQKSTIFPSKSALLSPAIPEVEKEEYSSPDESSSVEGEEENGEDNADNVSETRIEIEDVGRQRYKDTADRGDQDDLDDATETTKLLIDLEESDGEYLDKRQAPVELVITEPIDTQDAAEENKHLTVPWLIGGDPKKNGSDSSFKPGLFYIGSDLHTRLAVTTSGGSETPSPAISTATSAVPLYEGLSASAPVVVVLESDDHRPLVSTSIEQATIHTAVHVLDTSPKTSVSEDYDRVKFLLGEAEDAEDGDQRGESDSGSSSGSDDDDDEHDESSDEEKENKADSTHGQNEGQNHKEHKVHHEPLWQLQDETKIPAAKPRKHRKSHHKRENYKMADLERRRLRGSEVHIPDALKRVPTETEEAVTLHSADLDTMASHRMDDLKGFHKHKIGRKKHKTDKSRPGKPDKSRRKYFKPEAKKYDHTPHEVFVELDELYVNEEHHEVEWREKARWIKFEEDVEEGAERWGKPHVASLSFHSLIELRKGLEQGSLLLDLEATDLITICHRVVENMVIHDQIPSEVRGQVMRSLLTRHKFVSAETVKSLIQRNISTMDLTNLDQRHQREQASLMKTFSQASFTHMASSTNLASLAPNQNHNHESNNGQLNNHTTTNNFENQRSLTVPGDVRRVSINLPEETNHHSSKKDKSKKNKSGVGEAGRLEFVKVDVANKTDLEDGIHIGLVPKEVDKEELPRSDQNSTLLKRISRDAEACTVLIGQVNYLDKPAMAFVRLAEKQVLDNLTEVPLPVRFLFILLGPPKNAMDYHEVGRSIATLMANQHFHEIAYRAESRSEILHAINEFLNESIVLPPGDWDQKTLLPVMDMARKRAKIRRKKQKKKEELEALIQRERLHKIPMDPLKRTGRPFGGLINDIRRRYPHYASDFTDALSWQCVMALIFIFFACLCPCIAFGGLYGEKTNGKIGVVETILATSLTNIVFGFLSGQPLIVYGATGPVLVFEKQLYSFCKNSDIDFLTWRVWIGLWVFVITLIVLALEGSFIVRYITRFTEEVFAILISLIFINEVLQKLIAIYKEHPLREKEFYCDSSNNKLIDEAIIDLNSTTILPLLESVANSTVNATALLTSSISTYSTANLGNYSLVKNKSETEIYTHEKSKYVKITNEPNTALLSTILIFGTFLIAYFLRIFRNSKFLGRSARRALGDFGIFTAIILMVLFDYICADTFTQKLHLPETFSHSDSTISQWFVNPLGEKKPLQTWLMFIAVIPGFLFFLLLFLELQLTQMLLHKNEFKLKKGSGFHLDQFILGIITFLCGLFGLPWMCPATVRSVAHVSSLAVMSKTHAPGEKPKLIEVKDQRVTNLMMNLIIGSCIIWGELLRSVPMAVLFGVFLYLGVSAISGVQLFKRFKLLFMPVKHHPGKSYVRRVRTIKMHAFTIIQLVLVALLWIVKSTVVAIAFPLFVFLMVPLRLKVLPRFFTHNELEVLDKEEEDSEDEEDLDPDFYQLAHMPI